MKLTQQRSVAPQNFSSTRTKRFTEGIFSTTLWRRMWSRVETPNLKLRCNQDVIFTLSAYIISKSNACTILIGDWLCSKTSYVWGTSEILTFLLILHAFYSRRNLGIVTTLTELHCWRWIYGRHRALRLNRFGYSPPCVGTDLSLNQLSINYLPSLIITQPTNALIVCHLFLNHFF